ncbi:ABC transporter ATP-binding protein, partial [Propionibacterium acidifaciens]|uniref:ABC transporter ATP-binding protein n=1 Tax=Propionibacterium acidifaciens TaxID=556499 RepID=UPI00361B7002
MAQYLNDPLTSREHDPSAAIRLESLTKTFRAPNGGTITAVDDVSFTIDRGEVVAFLGPNGAGKSTTIDLALGLLGPDSGSARIFGLDPITAAHAGLVSAVMQSGGMLPDLTVRDLMHMVGGLFREAEVDRCMARANIDELADRKISTCSGGEIQRVRFGMALIPNPELMILDEPTAAMDVEARRTFWERVHEDAD